MSDTGKLYANGVTTDAEPGSCHWSDEGNCVVSDNIRASANMAGHLVTDNIFIYDFRAKVPANAAIDGIEVGIEARCSPTGQSIQLDYVEITCGGSSGAEDLSENLTATDAYYYAGDSTEKWDLGDALTPANVNAEEFQVAFCFRSPNMVGLVEVDASWVTIYYTDSVGNVDETVSFALTSSLSATEEVGGTAFFESVNFALNSSLGVAELVGVIETVAFALGSSLDAGHTDEQTAARIKRATGTIYNIELYDSDSVSEIKARKNIIHQYDDNSIRVYYTGAEVKRWNLQLIPTKSTVELIEALRGIDEIITFYPDYYRNKGTFYKCRIDNRAPLFYTAGAFDKDKILQLIIYEVGN